MDCEDLIERLNAYSAEHQCHGGITAEAADAIETLLAERDKALEELKDLKIMWDMFGGSEGITEAFLKANERDAALLEIPKDCSKCTHWGKMKTESPCRECWYSSGPKNNWRWRGPQKGNNP